MAAFTPSLPISSTSLSSDSRKLCTTLRHSRLRTRPRRSRIAETTIRCETQPARVDLPALRKQLEVALRGINRGLAIDADLPVLTSAEAQVEDILDILENNNPTPVPTKNPLMPGKWALIYTSSSITRYFGGVTGVQRLLPEGIVGEIYQIIDPEDGTSRFEEMVQWEIPMLGKAVDSVVVADGKIRATSEVRQMWEPMSVKSGFWSWFADNWKTLRAFQVADTTYLDDELRITRGQTGSVNVFRRV